MFVRFLPFFLFILFSIHYADASRKKHTKVNKPPTQHLMIVCTDPAGFESCSDEEDDEVQSESQESNTSEVGEQTINVSPLIHQLHISFRTSPTTNQKIYEDYLLKIGIPKANISKGHLTYGWITDIAEDDLLPLKAYIEEFVRNLDPLEYTFKIDSVGLYVHQRKPGDTPLILLPENPFPFEELNRNLDSYVKRFKGSKLYALDVGTAPEHFVPHITIVDEKIVNEKKIEIEKTRRIINKAIATNRQTYCFSSNLVKIKEKGGMTLKLSKKQRKKLRRKEKKKKKLLSV